MGDERIEQVKAFLRAGKSVCPFAKTYIDNMVFSSVSTPIRDTVKDPILALVGKKELMAAVYVFDTDEHSHQKERERDIRWFKTAYRTLFTQENGSVEAEVLSQLEKELDAAFAPSSRINLFLNYGGKPFFSIAMNPLYEEVHPRWAPCASLVVTRQEDVAAVPKASVESIRKEVARRVGRVYDADELYLMPKAVIL